MREFNFFSFVSTKKDGNMNTNANFFPEGMTKEARIQAMRENKQKVADRLGTTYKKMFMPIQKSADKKELYEDGHMLILDKGIVELYDDLYDYDYYCDIVKITRDVPYVAICYPIADCALVSAVNIKTKEAVIAHCSGECINRYLPMQLIDKLGGNEEDIRVHVSPFAHNLVYKTGEPSWISNEQIWKDSLTRDENGLNINQLKTLQKMFKDRKIDKKNIYYYPFDTIKDNQFYSNSNAYNGVKDDAGRFISGVILTDNYNNSIYTKRFY